MHCGEQPPKVAILHFKPQADHRMVESLFAETLQPAFASSPSAQPARSAAPAWQPSIPRTRQELQSLLRTTHRLAASDHSFEGVPDGRMPNHSFCRNTAEHLPRSGSADYTSVGLILRVIQLRWPGAPRGIQRDPVEF